MVVQTSSRVPDISILLTSDAASRLASTNPLGVLQALIQYERERQASNGTPTMGAVTASTSTDAVTAHAGGGQALGVPITTAITRVTVVGTAADSLTLPVSRAGLRYTVINATATSLTVYPNVGGTAAETINVLSANAGFAIAAAKVVEFICGVAGQWHTILTA